MGTKKELIDVQTAAKRLGVNSRTVRRWIQIGAIEAMISPGGRYQVVASSATREKIYKRVEAAR